MTATSKRNTPAIIFVNRFFYPDQSATSQLLSDLAFDLARDGHRVHVVCSAQRYDDATARLKRSEIVDQVTVHRVRTTRFGRSRLAGRAVDYASFYISSFVRLLLLVRRGDVLVAKTDPPLISVAAMLVAALRGARLINWLQDVFPEVATQLGANPLPSVLDRILVWTRDVSLRAAEVNVVLGARMRDRLQALGVPMAKIDIIENWAEAPREPSAPGSPNALREKHALADAFVVGYSGNLGRAHEFATMLDAATQLRGDPGIVFLMIGGGAGVTELRRRVIERGLENVRFLPYQPREDLHASLTAVDVHWVSLLPELEGLIVPSKIYGILAAARPAVFVGDPEGEVARVLREARCGFSVRPGEAAELVHIVRRLQHDRALCATLGMNGWRWYSQHCTPARAFERWRAALDLPRVLVPPVERSAAAGFSPR